MCVILNDFTFLCNFKSKWISNSEDYLGGPEGSRNSGAGIDEKIAMNQNFLEYVP